MKKHHKYFAIGVVSLLAQPLIGFIGFMIGILFILLGEDARKKAKNAGYADENTLDPLPGIERDLK